VTALQLLGFIVAALLLQLTAGIAVVAFRRRRASAVPAAPSVDIVPKAGSGAWSGWREFRVTHRHFEDASQSQCSFHLAPVDGAPLPPLSPAS